VQKSSLCLLIYSFFSPFLNISFLILILIVFPPFFIYRNSLFHNFLYFLLSLLPYIFLSSLVHSFVILFACLAIYVLSNSLISFFFAFLLLCCPFVFFFYKLSLLLLSLLLASFPLGSFSLCFRKHPILMAYCIIPLLDIPTFSTSSALPRPLSRESCSCNPVI
jgi:hypothetical protein